MDRLSSYANATLDDLVKDPEKYGVPTFEEFMRLRDRERLDAEQLYFKAFSDQPGSSNIGHLITSIRYKCFGHDCGKSLEQVQRVAENEGVHHSQLVFKPEMTQDTAGKYKLMVNVATKEWFEKRDEKSPLATP
jgi:hypothetical protein